MTKKYFYKFIKPNDYAKRFLLNENNTTDGQMSSLIERFCLKTCIFFFCTTAECEQIAPNYDRDRP